MFQQLTQSTSIESCITANFTSTNATNVILNKGDHLDIYDLQQRQNRLTFVLRIPLFGRPEAIAAFRPHKTEPDHLALVLRRGRHLAVVKHDAEVDNAHTCGQHVLLSPEDPAAALGPSGFRPQIAVDPDNRCLAARILPDRVVVFPISGDGDWQLGAGAAVSQHGGLAFHQDPGRPPGLGVPFTFDATAPLRLHHLEDMAFLHGHQRPTAVCLGQARPGWGGCLGVSNQGNSSVLVVVLDLAERTPHLIWATHGLPHDVFRVVPLSLPVGGMLALSNNAVIYMKEHGGSFCQLLNGFANLGVEFSHLPMGVKDESKLGIQLSGCSIAVLSPTALLVSVQPTGRLYLAQMLLTSRDDVVDILWVSPGTAVPAWDLCCVKDEYAFLAASGGGSMLLKLKQVKKKLPKELQPKKRARTTEPKEDKDGPSERLKSLLELHEKLQDADRFIYSYEFSVADELESVSAVQCLAPWVRSHAADGEDDEEAPLCGTERFISCSGKGSRGALHIFQRSVPLETLTEFDLPTGPRFSAVWTLPEAPEEPVIAEAKGSTSAVSANEDSESGLAKDEQDTKAKQAVAEVAAAVKASANAAAALASHATDMHRYVLLGGVSGSMLLEATEIIEQIPKTTPIDTSAATVCAGAVLCSRLAVQVTPQRMCFMSTRDARATNVPVPFDFVKAKNEVEKAEDDSIKKEGVSSGEAVGGSILDPYVAVRFQDGSLRLFAIHGEGDVHELSNSMPDQLRKGALSVSILRDSRAGAVFLAVATSSCQGTIHVIDLATMKEVFHAEHLAEVPPVLRDSHISGVELDHLRALSDVCAPLPKTVVDALLVKAKEAAVKEDIANTSLPSRDTSTSTKRTGPGSASTTQDLVSAELVEVDPADRGPTLVVLVIGRPILIYRAFVRYPQSIPGEKKADAGEETKFPYHFALQEHSFLEMVTNKAEGPYRAAVPFRRPRTGQAGVVVSPPHTGVPALWLAAQRNQLFVHPIPGTQVRSFAPLQAPCCESGFFALSQGPSVVAAQVFALATISGFPEDGQSNFDLHTSIPRARKFLNRTPHCLATRPEDKVIALAVSEQVLETQDAPGPNIDEDPLGDDWSIVRQPPVEFEPPPVPRLQPRFELWIDHAKDIDKLGQYRFSFDADEHVLCLAWMTLPGFPSPSLAVGTGVNTGEDMTCRGRLFIFSTKDREPGIVPATYQRSLKWPVTVVGQWGNYFMHSEGFKLFFEHWENGNFTKLAFFDGSMCITSMSSIKNFLLLGDLRKGLDFVQWKEDTNSQTRNLRRLSRSPPSTTMTVIACDFVVCQKSLGMLALDHTGSAHLFQYTAHSDGREGDQLLRSCATFAMGAPCRASMRLQAEPGVQCLLLASARNELFCIRPIDDQVYRTITTLLGMLTTRLPFRCGLNPRAFRSHDGPPALVAPRKNIEDAVLLRLFAFLSKPLQASVADKMRLSVAALTRATLPSASCQLFALRPAPDIGK